MTTLKGFLTNWRSEPALSRIPAMEGIRGFAVTMVFLVHYVALLEPWTESTSVAGFVGPVIAQAGHSGVDLFFILSGFLIYGMLIDKPRPLLQYSWRRIVRIYPTFLVVFLVYLCLSWLFPERSKLPADPVSALVLIGQNLLLLPGLFKIEPIISVAWSLSYEMFFYLSIPVLIHVLRLRSWTPEHRIGLFLVIAIVIFTLCMSYVLHYTRSIMFLSGIVLFDLIKSGQLRKLPALGLPVFLLTLLVIGTMDFLEARDYLRYPLLFVAFMWFCRDAFTHSGWAMRLFSWNPLRQLGNISYSYYLIHGLVLNMLTLPLQKFFPTQLLHSNLFWWFLPIAYVLTIIFSVILYAVVEKRFSIDILNRSTRAGVKGTALVAPESPAVDRPEVVGKTAVKACSNNLSLHEYKGDAAEAKVLRIEPGREKA